MTKRRRKIDPRDDLFNPDRWSTAGTRRTLTKRQLDEIYGRGVLPPPEDFRTPERIIRAYNSIPQWDESDE